MDVLKVCKELVELVPEKLRVLAGHVLSAGLYASFYTFTLAYTQSWDLSLAATAGFRAFFLMVVDMLPLPKDTKAKGEKPRSRFVL